METTYTSERTSLGELVRLAGDDAEERVRASRCPWGTAYAFGLALATDVAYEMLVTGEVLRVTIKVHA